MQRKYEKNSLQFCPKCGSPKIKLWSEMTPDEKFMIERLPLSSDLTLEERKQHRFCARCFYEERGGDSEQA